jgi:ribosomal protein S18 acetylase RimI-like enzyme
MIRLANLNDVNIIANFNKQLAWETEQLVLDDEIITEGVKAIINDSTKGFYYVYELNGEVVGQLLITFEYSDWRNANIWWIQSVYVAKAYRKQGIFSELYQHVKKIVDNDKKIAGIRLYVEKENKGAQRTYQKLGMTESEYHLYQWLK